MYPGGKHWTRQSKGLWDTRVLGVWLHPGDTKGGHVFAGTHSGIYESTDFAESWQLVNETANWCAGAPSVRKCIIITLLRIFQIQIPNMISPTHQSINGYNS